MVILIRISLLATAARPKYSLPEHYAASTSLEIRATIGKTYRAPSFDDDSIYFLYQRGTLPVNLLMTNLQAMNLPLLRRSAAPAKDKHSSKK
eukprot:scaffold3302_cov146-Skeletonema_menzelii.AAC.4